LISFLNDELDYSTFPTRTGDHIESRPGGINFSILGRGEGNMEGREEYVKWDRNTGERIAIADRIKNQFPDLNVQIGGQTGLDISDSDKSQIIKYFNHRDEIHFFGDMMEEGQNDYPLAKAVQERGGKTYHVKDWEETRLWVNRFSSSFASGLKYN
jgi:phosphomannomutase